MNPRPFAFVESRWNLCPPSLCSSTRFLQALWWSGCGGNTLGERSPTNSKARSGRFTWPATKPTENAFLWATGLVILVAFVARGFTGWYAGEGVLTSMVPQSLHGFMGPVGFGLMVFMTRLGKQARTQRQAGESFAVAKLKHGRAADLIIYLVFIHAFLGFIYTFDVLM